MSSRRPPRRGAQKYNINNDIDVRLGSSRPPADGCAKTSPVDAPSPAITRRARPAKRAGAPAKIPGAVAGSSLPRRWQVATALDAPASVRRVLGGYNPARLVWADPDHRYVIVRESLIRGDRSAVRWLRSVLRPGEIRELVRRNRGTGCNESERQRLRKTLRLNSTDIPIRPF